MSQPLKIQEIQNLIFQKNGDFTFDARLSDFSGTINEKDIIKWDDDSHKILCENIILYISNSFRDYKTRTCGDELYL